MNITFVVGNGLDLSLGLKTSYKDFYNHVRTDNLHPKNKIYKAIENDPDTWSSFEHTLGTYTQYLEDLSEEERAGESLKFHNDLGVVTEDLGNYLESQIGLLDYGDNNVGLTRFSFFEELSSGQRDRIRSFIGNESLVFNLLTLNYTDSLEKILPSRGSYMGSGNIMVESIHHIHGELSEYIALGVSDESQISSALIGEERDDLIKPRLVASMNDDRINKMQKIMNNSSIIVLFGTSMGDTDKYIWKGIIDWLGNSRSRYIIIHKYDPAYTTSVTRIPRRKKLFISEVQNGLLDNAEITDEDEKSELRSRIFVIHNTKKLFTDS